MYNVLYNIMYYAMIKIWWCERRTRLNRADEMRILCVQLHPGARDNIKYNIIIMFVPSVYHGRHSHNHTGCYTHIYVYKYIIKCASEQYILWRILQHITIATWGRLVGRSHNNIIYITYIVVPPVAMDQVITI